MVCGSGLLPLLMCLTMVLGVGVLVIKGSGNGEVTEEPCGAMLPTTTCLEVVADEVAHVSAACCCKGMAFGKVMVVSDRGFHILHYHRCVDVLFFLLLMVVWRLWD